MNNTNKMKASIPLILLLVFSSILGTLPFFSLISISIGPIIVALIYHKAEKSYVGLSFAIMGIILAMMTNLIYALTMTMLIFIIGAGLIYMISKNQGVLINFIVLTIAVISGYLIITFVDITVINNITISEYLTLMVDGLKASMTEVASLYEQAGGVVSENPAIASFEALTVSSLLNFLPTLVTMYGLLAATIIYKVASMVFKRMNVSLKPIPEFSQIKTNMVLVIATLLVAMLGVILVALGIPEAEGIMLLGNNLFILSGAVGGLSLVSYFMQNKLKYPTIFRVIILVLIVASSLSSVMMIVGIIDSAFDFRKLRENGLYKLIQSKMDNTK